MAGSLLPHRGSLRARRCSSPPSRSCRVIIFLPLLGAVAIAFTPRDRPDLARTVALGASGLSWVFSLVLVVSFILPTARTASTGFQQVEQADWIPAFGIQYKLGVDGLSLVLVVLTTTLSGSASWRASGRSRSG